jgi:1-deoxy-D-xylulose-5-phosphate reductoisomerase
MTERITVLGSTGSIGIQTLEVARRLKLSVTGLCAHSNIELLYEQAMEFKPYMVGVYDKSFKVMLEQKLSGTGISVVSGVEGMCDVASIDDADTVVAAVVGIAGLRPVLEAIRAGKRIALANKETLVTAGQIVMAEANKNGSLILPVDSEHSAIFQCLMGNERTFVSKVILTASGGPFRGKSFDELREVTVKEALKHPNWKMGRKITIDSATLMNKGLEVIEAKWLFGLEPSQIDVVVHPQSIIHSMVEYSDGSVIAQLGPSDMKLPIQYALTYPDRGERAVAPFNFKKLKELTFEEPDYEAFPCLGLAYDALSKGGTMPAAMNAANEEAVGMFLEGKIGFTDIPDIIKNIMEKHNVNIFPSIDDIIETDEWSRQEAVKLAGLLI